jgi:hypothetical protein
MTNMTKQSELPGQRGFTLVEVTIILLVLVILSTIMLPQLGNFNRLARYVVVQEDVGAICASLKKFLDEVMLPGPFAHPGGSDLGGVGNGAHAPANPVGLLVGPGSIPNVAAVTNPAYSASGAYPQIWEAVAAKGVAAFSVTPDDGGTDVSFEAAQLEFHLQVNSPWTANNLHGRYKNALDDPAVGPFFGWRGPYFNQLNADPWGTRYSVNTFGLHSGTDGATDNVFMTAVVCISFGPDKGADTEANMPGPPTAGPVYAIGGDDVAAILSAAGPF